tara:strand:- start:640 stop:1056 length:417 start_codon:yes stop_codon:yes gene_type:complete
MVSTKQKKTIELKDLRANISVKNFESKGLSIKAFVLDRIKSKLPDDLVIGKTKKDNHSFFEIVAIKCQKEKEFLNSELPILELIFRILLLRKNNPTKMKELYRVISDELATPYRPMTISMDQLISQISRDNYYSLVIL